MPYLEIAARMLCAKLCIRFAVLLWPPIAAMISEVDSRYLENIMLAGIKSWYIVLSTLSVRNINNRIEVTYASSLGLKADRTKPVPSCTGFPLPLLSRVSVALVVVRSQV